MRGERQTLDADAPVLEPVDVGSIGGQSVGGVERKPFALTVSLDPDAVPGLREALLRQREGVSLDVVSQWRALVPDDVSVPPVVFLYVRFPELETAFQIRFPVDDYKRSLSVAARTGHVMLFEPNLTQALRTEEPEKAFREHLSIAFIVANVDVLRNVLQQRFDLPFPERREQPRVFEPAEAGAELERFTQNAVQPDGIRVLTAPGARPVVVVADEQAAEALEVARSANSRRGHWASAQVGPHFMARLDILAGTKRLRSWLLPEPDPVLVRATSSGPHEIVVITQPAFQDRDALQKQLQEGVEFLVEEAPDAMRALLR